MGDRKVEQAENNSIVITSESGNNKIPTTGDNGYLLTQKDIEQGDHHTGPEQKQMPDNIELSDLRFRNALGQMMEGCQIIGYDWRYIYLNETAIKQAQQKPDMLLDHTMMEAYPGIEQTEMFGFMEKCMSQRIPHQMQNKFTYPDGSVGWFDLSILPVPEGIFILSNDITERKLAEENIRKTTERLSLAQEASNSGTWDWDIVNDSYYWSEEFLDVFGMKPGTIPGFESWLATLHPDDREIAVKRIQDAIERKVNLENDYRVILPDGNIRWIRATGKTFYKDQTPLRMLGLCMDITDRKKVEEALRESEERFVKAFQSNPAALSISRTSDGLFEEVNESFIRLFEYDRDALIGAKSSNLNLFENPEDLAELKHQLKEVGKVRNLEIKAKTKTGNGLTVLVSAEKINFKGEEHILYTTINITDRKKFEEALEEAKVRTSTILEGIADTFYSLDEQWRFTVVNPAAEKAPFGRPASELLGKNIWELYPDLVGTAIYQHYLDASKYSRLEHYIAQSPLNLRWYEVFMQGRKGKVDVYMRDITHQKTAEEALRISEERYRSLVEQVPDGIFLADEQGRYLDANSTGLQMLGYDLEELRKLTVTDVIVPQEITRMPLQFEQLNKGNLVVNEWQFRRKDGSRFEGEVVGRVMPDGKLLGILRNITNRKKAEVALRESEAKYRNLFENMTEEVHFWQLVRDGEGQIKTWRLVDANPPALATWGIKSIEEIRGKTTDEIFGPGSTQHYMPIVQKIMKEGSPYFFEDYFEHLDKYFRFTSVPVGDYFITTGADITASRKATEALRESEEKYRTLIETAGEGIVISKTNGEITFANRQFQEMLGYTEAELIGKTGFDIAADDIMPSIPSNREVLKKGNILYGEFKFKRNDGSEIITLYSASPLFDKDGNHIANFAMHTDITESKKTEQALIQSRLNLDRAQEVGKMGWWKLDTQKNVLTWSDENYRIFELSKDIPLTYETFLGTIHSDDRAYVDKMWASAMQGHPYDIEHRIVTGGKVKWVREKAYLEFDQAKNLLGGFGITQDITYRKITEEALRESEATLSGILNAATESIWLFSKDGIALLGNQTALERFGQDSSKIIGRSCFEFLPKDLAKSRAENLKKVAESGLPICFEDVRNGIHFEHNFYPVVSPDGNVSRIAIFSRDITERKQAEAALIKYQEELEATVKARTQELQKTNEHLRIEIDGRKQKEQALIDSQKHLRELAHRMDTIAEEERIRIAREIHDEIGHLLTALKYDAERLVTTPELSSELLNQGIDAMISMIDAVIDTVRKISTELRPGILDHLGLIPAIEWQIKQFSKRTKIYCHYTPVEINRNFNKNETIIIFRIVQEILTNIIRHANASKVKITISEKNDRFQLRISDNGVGFEVKDDLFNGSLGILGMRERALTIGAEIKIKSRIGKGTEINFILGK
jgi:PAS domain S-box-containing protein